MNITQRYGRCILGLSPRRGASTMDRLMINNMTVPERPKGLVCKTNNFRGFESHPSFQLMVGPNVAKINGSVA